MSEKVRMPRPRTKLSADAARRVALAASGFGIARPEAVHAGQMQRCIDRLGLLQIDSVNVLVRAHYMPLFSRLGAYDRALLDRVAWGRKGQRRLFEFWAHEASLLPLVSQPLLRWRMQHALKETGGKGKLRTFRRERKKFIDEVLREITDKGPLAASELENGGAGRGAWWGWSDGKLAVEWLFYAGIVTTATRRGTFERVYDLTERVLPATIQALPTPSEDEAQRELLRLSARALGVATEFDLRDYYPPRRRRDQGAARRAGRGGRAAAGRGRGLGPAGLSRSCRARSRARSRRARCWRRSIRWSGSATARSASSTSSIASRSTPR